MGAFEQFKDKADAVAEQAKGQMAKGQMSGKRNKPAGAEKPERAERGMPQGGRERQSEDQAERRMDREPNEDRDDWA